MVAMKQMLTILALVSMAVPAAPAMADRDHHHHWDHDRDHHGWHWHRGHGWYPERHYHRGRVWRLGRGDRIYRGYDGQYYCRRSDGTTGLIVGALAGGLLGNALAPGRSETLGTLLGAGGGALIGRAIDRDNVECY